MHFFLRVRALVMKLSLRKRIALATGAFLIWAGLLIASFTSLTRYEVTPGAAAASPRAWPPESSIQRTAGRPMVLMFVHPRCPCTRASMVELNQVMHQQASEWTDSVIVFFDPDGRVRETEAWSYAGTIPHTLRVIDANARERDRFGVRTSGQVLFFAGDGSLRFSGGITASRGHIGSNMGRTALLAGLAREAGESGHAVYGCGLDDQLAAGDTP